MADRLTWPRRIAVVAALIAVAAFFFGSTGLTTVVLGEGITEIWDDAFYGCDKLESVNIPESVEEIGERAFYGCKKLKHLAIPGHVEDIGDYAFSSTGLEAVEIAEGVTEHL